tara:strand:- start:4970 stop:5992 length:1023 start_codon:yes stop_codon:yes gene_type:complete
MSRTFDDASRYDFFQAVRVVEEEAQRVGRKKGVGADLHPNQEPMRFTVHPSLAFPESPVRSITPPSKDKPAMVEVRFFGMTGAAGVLPRHYTERIIHRGQAKDRTLRDFLDSIHHRSVSLFYRAWKKYRLTASYEPGQVASAKTDPVSTILQGLTGMGTPELPELPGLDHDALKFVAGQLGRVARSAAAIEDVIKSLLRVPVRLQQFVPRDTQLEQQDRSRVMGPGVARDDQNRLGRGFLLGDEVVDVQTCVRFSLGPLTLEEMSFFRPGEVGAQRLASLAKMTLQGHLEAEYECILAPGESPGIRLGGERPTRLGHDTWLETESRASGTRAATFSVDRN